MQKSLAKQMEAASSDLDFERAAIYRDRLSALSHVQSHQGINPQSVTEADVFAVYQSGGMTCIQVFFFRTGQNWGNRAYFPRADKSIEPEEVLGAFLGQFYDDRPCPRNIFLSHDTGSVPQRGEKRELVEHVATNAKEALERKLAETSTQHQIALKFSITLIFKVQML